MHASQDAYAYVIVFKVHPAGVDVSDVSALG